MARAKISHTKKFSGLYKFRNAFAGEEMGNEGGIRRAKRREEVKEGYLADLKGGREEH